MANPTVTIETNHGTITAEFYMDVAPKTAGNFIELVKGGVGLSGRALSDVPTRIEPA